MEEILEETREFWEQKCLGNQISQSVDDYRHIVRDRIKSRANVFGDRK